MGMLSERQLQRYSQARLREVDGTWQRAALSVRRMLFGSRGVSLRSHPSGSYATPWAAHPYWPRVEFTLRQVLADNIGRHALSAPLRATLGDLGVELWDRLDIASDLEEAFRIELQPDWSERYLNHASIGHIIEGLLRDYGSVIAEDVSQDSLVFRVRDDGSLAVGIRYGDGTWSYADGSSRLPSGIYVVTKSGWSATLDELESIINNPHAREAELQHFFERHPDLLRADEYDVIISQACIIDRSGPQPRKWRADFVLTPIDQVGFCKVLELKRPSIKVARDTSQGHARFYSELNAAIGQLVDYGRAFNDSRTRRLFSETYKVNVYAPDLQLVVGRRWDVEAVPALLEFQRRQDLRIDSWDSLLARLRRRFG